MVVICKIWLTFIVFYNNLQFIVNEWSKEMELNHFLRKAKIRVSKMAADIGVAQPTVSSWKNGVSIPTKNQMAKVVKYTKGLVMPNDFFPDLVEKFGKASQ